MEQSKEAEKLLSFVKQDIKLKVGYLSWGATYEFSDNEHLVYFVIMEDQHAKSPFFGFTAAFRIYCRKHKDMSDIFEVPKTFLTFEEAEDAANKELQEITDHVRRVAENGGC